LGPLASLTRVDACNPPTASAPDLGAGRTRRPRDFHLSHARLRPPRLSPLRARPRARPIWAGARSTLTRRLRDPLSRNADIHFLARRTSKSVSTDINKGNFRSLLQRFRSSFGSLAFSTITLKNDKGKGIEEYGKKKYKIEA
jgi:hypothetical protein